MRGFIAVAIFTSFIMAGLFGNSCSSPAANGNVISENICDTSSLVAERNYWHNLSDTLLLRIHKQQDQNDRLMDLLFLSDYKINKVKFYLEICERDPSQRKYLRGWVTRAVK